jgi:hypothetical protein
MTKYAEWVYMDPDRGCDCRNLIDIAMIVETVLDPPDCEQHRKRRCLICGRMSSRSTVFEGTLGGPIHRPQFEGATNEKWHLNTPKP